mgnify:CR=1 FL=1
MLERHGVRLKLDLVRDPGLSLVRSVVRPKAARGTAAKRAATSLAHCLDDLERWVKVARLRSP